MKEGITREIEDIKFQKDSIVKIFMLFFSNWTGTSLVVQWLRIHLPMQGTQCFPAWGNKILHAMG